jgi:hypothetical protein
MPGCGGKAPAVHGLDEEMQIVEVEPHAPLFTFVDFRSPNYPLQRQSPHAYIRSINNGETK